MPRRYSRLQIKKEAAFDSGLVPLPQRTDDPDPLDMHRARWLVERMICLQKDPDFKGAVRKITDCQRAVTREIKGSTEVLADLLAMFACLEVCRSRGGCRKWLLKVWSADTGKAWKALREFPGRLQRMAKETEQVIASPLFVAATFTREKAVKGEMIRRHLHQLPGTMRLCAMALEAFIARLPDFIAEAFSTPGEGNEPLLRLSQVAKMATGKWHDREVANLLNAAARALDKEREFDALTITQARFRRKKKQKR